MIRPGLRAASTALAIALATTLPVGGRLAAQSDEEARVLESARVLEEIMMAPDQGITRGVLDNAHGIAVFPSMIKGGFIVAAQRGRGILSGREHPGGTWSAPAFLTITGGSVGLQAGGEAVDLVLVVMNRRGLEKLAENNFKVGGDASVAAGPIGREATAGTDVTFRAEILSYSRARGLFAGVSLKGAAIRADRDANERFYGRSYSTREIVLERLGGAPPAVATWRDTLVKLIRPSGS